MSNPYGSEPTPQSPEPQPSAPTYGSPSPAPEFGGAQAAPGDQFSGAQYTGGPSLPPAQPPKKRWPLFVGIGCGCLALLAILGVILAVAIGASGGKDDEKTASPAATTSASSSAAPSKKATTSAAPTTDAATPAAAPAGDADLESAKQSFAEFVNASASGDYQTACSHMLNPMTKEPMDGSMASACAEGMKGEDPAAEGMGSIQASQVEAKANPDGSVTISYMGSDFPFPMVKASDGKYYVSVQE